MIRVHSIVVLILLPPLLAGCQKTPPLEFRFNSVELLKQERLFLETGQEFDASYQTEIQRTLNVLFGTPDEPRFPFLDNDQSDNEIVNLEELRIAAGPVTQDASNQGQGLYREYCVCCHGITGDGAGSMAESLNPYPRDFRLGKFKFKSTPLRSPPTDEDLTRILKHGIPGSSMPSFTTLADGKIAALIAYIKYLSIRGEFERVLLAELNNIDGEPLIEANANTSWTSETVLDSIGEELLEDVLARWNNPQQHVTPVPPAPANYATNHVDHSDLTTLGKQLFLTKGNCAQCHGLTGTGDGPMQSFDDWTNDWLKTPGVYPFDETSWAAFRQAGALPPRPIQPRNLNEGIFRGGDHANDLYRRIANGIEGTSMPSSAAMTHQEIWALVAYVQSLKH